MNEKGARSRLEEVALYVLRQTGGGLIVGLLILLPSFMILGLV